MSIPPWTRFCGFQNDGGALYCRRCNVDMEGLKKIRIHQQTSLWLGAATAWLHLLWPDIKDTEVRDDILRLLKAVERGPDWTESPNIRPDRSG